MIRSIKIFAIVLILSTVHTAAQQNTTYEETSKDKQHRLTFFMVGGVPDNKDASHPVKVLINDAFAVGYSEERQNPVWSAYHVDQISNAPDHDRPKKFHTDIRTESKISGDMTFRRDSEPKYDRGHMTPNNAIQQEWGRLAQMETFLMSNISPQISSLNSGKWKSLEHDITERLVGKVDDLWVIAGPVFGEDPEEIKDTDIQIPDQFYMILVDQYYSQARRALVYGSIAFMFPNNREDLQDKALEDFLSTVDDIEAAAKLDFFKDFSSTEKFDESREGDFNFWFGEH